MATAQFYDKNKVDSLLSVKQDTISDLEAIHAGAAAGATAVQPGDLAAVATSGNYNDLSNKPTLGTAASKNVGTGSNEVAAGNHTHSSISGNGITVSTNPNTLMPVLDIDGNSTGVVVNIGSHTSADGSTDFLSLDAYGVYIIDKATENNWVYFSRDGIHIVPDWDNNHDYVLAFPQITSNKTIATTDHTHSSIVAGDTTVSAVNGGTATITKSGLGNAKVTFPEGFSVTVGNKTYTAPSGGETIEFIGPYEIEPVPGAPVTLWIPSSYADDPQSFSPGEDGGQWFIEWLSDDTAQYYLGFYLIDEGSVYLVSNFNSLNPTLRLDDDVSHSGQYVVGGPATITRESIDVKTVATVDQLNHLTSADGTVTVTAQNDGTVTIEKPGAEIDMDDLLGSLIDYLGLPDGTQFDTVRQALGLSAGATLEQAAAAVPSSIDKTVATLDDVEPKLDADQRNIVPYATSADLTLDPETTVYRLSPTGTDIAIPTPVDTAIPATDGYYQFEIELAVPATATSLTAPSGWTWLPGFELPQYDYAGKTVYVSCRIDCRTKAVTASCWRVA